MAYSAFDVTKYIIIQFNEKNGGISNLKLQKVLYYAQMKTLNENGCALFYEPIEAWRHGPVVSPLYSKLKKYNSNAISFNDEVFQNSIELSDSAKSIIDDVVSKTLKTDPWDLVRKTHKTSPWKNYYVAGLNNIIPNCEIKSGEFNI